MSEPLKHDPAASKFAEPTRDIRLPPLPGRVLPPQWRTDDAASGPSADASEAAPVASAAPVVAATPAPVVESSVAQAVEVPVADPQPADPQPADAPLEPRPSSISDEPTDSLAPPGMHPRHRTLTFGAPGEEGGSPAAVPPHYSLPRVVPAPPRSRRWPWAVLIALPLIVIAVAAVLLIVLLRGA